MCYTAPTENVPLVQFSETILGRFLQSVELYVLVLFVLISAFYKMPVRSSVVAELVRRRLAQSGYANLEDGDRQNSLIMRQNSMVADDGDLRDVSRRSGLSGGRQSGGGQSGERPSLVQRLSSASYFPSRLISRRNSTRTGSGERRQVDEADEEGDQRRLWNQGEAEMTNSPIDQKTTRGSIEQTPTQTPMAEAQDAPGWKDPLFTSVVSEDPLRRLPPAVLPLSTTVGAGDNVYRVPPQITRSPESPVETITQPEIVRRSEIVIAPRSATDSPIYGLDGIIRNLQVGGLDGGRESNITSTRSSGLESLLRQQDELDKSIAGLRNFSPTTIAGSTRVQSESIQSEFSLSNFPDPPFLPSPTPPKAALPDNSDQSLPINAADRSKSLISDSSFYVDDVPFQMVQPRMPIASSSNQRGQNQSVSSVFSDATESFLGLGIAQASRNPRLDSQGTQYDVTSFIGGLFSCIELTRFTNHPHIIQVCPYQGKSVVLKRVV